MLSVIFVVSWPFQKSVIFSRFVQWYFVGAGVAKHSFASEYKFFIFQSVKILFSERKKKADKFQASMSLIMVACKRMIPIGMSYMNSLVQETIQIGKQKFLEVSKVFTQVKFTILQKKLKIVVDISIVFIVHRNVTETCSLSRFVCMLCAVRVVKCPFWLVECKTIQVKLFTLSLKCRIFLHIYYQLNWFNFEL